MAEWVKIGFGIGSGLILAVVAFALVLGIIDALSVKIRWWLLRKRAREEG
jgi:hypothetical protein